MRPNRIVRCLVFAAGLALLSSFLQLSLCAQDTAATGTRNVLDTLVIRHITLKGNKITRPSVILREMTVKTGDTVTTVGLGAAMRASRQNIFNTSLFNFVTVDTTRTVGSRETDLLVTVVERWYLWPIPIFEISERNFNVWWETKDLSRLTYGLDLTLNNVRGRNETLRMLIHFGYNQLYGFTYSVPGLNRKRTIGLAFGSGLELNHQMPVMTVNNKQVYVKDTTGYLRKIAYGYAELQLRPDYYTHHYIRLAYNYFFFSEGVPDIAGFSLSDDARQQFVTLSYIFRNDHRDVAYYPLKGYVLDLEFNHTIPYEYAHNTYVKANLRGYWHIGGRWYFGSGATGKVTFAKKQPYFLQRGLGYGREVVRGYEYYVVDGQHFILLKSDLRFAILPQHVFTLKFIRTSKFNTIPLAIYTTVFADAGYVHNYRHSDPDYQKQHNNLENSMLCGIGLGVDLTTYYDVVIRFEAALNRLGQTGLFLNFIAPI